MLTRLAVFLELALVFKTSLAAPPPAPTANLDNATVVGYTNNSVTSFMGIPFAEPPCVSPPPLPVSFPSYVSSSLTSSPPTDRIPLSCQSGRPPPASSQAHRVLQRDDRRDAAGNAMHPADPDYPHRRAPRAVARHDGVCGCPRGERRHPAERRLCVPGALCSLEILLRLQANSEL